MKDKLYNIALCLHGVTNDPNEVGPYSARVSDVKAQVNYLRSLGYKFVNGKQYKQWLDKEWFPTEPIVCLMWDDARGNIELIIPWFIAEKIPCCIPIITRRQRKYHPEDGFCSWAQMRDWVIASEGRIDIMSHTHDIHHLSIQASENNALTATNDPIFEGPCWVDNGDYLFIQNPATNQDWYWSQKWIEAAFAIPIWGVDQYTGTDWITTSFTVTPKVTNGAIKVIRFWASLTVPSGSGYAIPVRIKAGTTVIFNGTITPTDYGKRQQWQEREWVSINLTKSFKITAGKKIKLTFETMMGQAGQPMMTCCCLPVYHEAPTNAAGFNDAAFFAETTAKGFRPAGSEGAPDRTWQYMDFPPNDKWPVVPIMILGDGTGAPVSQAVFKDYLGKDIAASQNALKNYLMAEWTEVLGWEGLWDNWNYDWEKNFALDQQVWDADTGLQLVGWSKPKTVSAILPAVATTTMVVECLRFDFGAKIPVEAADWDTAWEDAQLRNYSIIFDILVSDDKLTWTKVGETATWIIFNGRPCDIEPTTWSAGVVKYIKLKPINRGTTRADLPEQHTVTTVSAVYLMEKNKLVSAPTDSLCYPFGAYQSSWMHDDFPELYGPADFPEHKDVSNTIREVLHENGITTAYTIEALRNIIHNGSDIGYDSRTTNLSRGRYMVTGDTPLADTLNLLAAYSGALFPDTHHMGERWQVSLEGDLLGHGTLKRRVNTIDYFAFDAWAFSGDNTFSIVKTSSPVNDGTAFNDDGKLITYADEKTWLQERGALALIIINNNLGTGSPDSVAGKHVLDNADAYIANIVNDCLTLGWDGVTCNIEGVDVTVNNGADIIYRDRATNFYKKLGRACHANGLILHMTAPAVTGHLPYDFPSWAGWCDHAAIVPYVDGMKIMSYTESAEWSQPRPAAWDVAPMDYYNRTGDTDPRSFWQAVTEYCVKTIPKQFKRRILMGGRAFGHIWYPNWKTGEAVPEEIANAEGFDPTDLWWKYTDEFSHLKRGGENGYMNYTQLIAEACTAGVPIQQNLAIDTTELTIFFPTTEAVIWCGSPLTGARSQKTAVNNGFGGVGIWKIDDGDVQEYFPEFKQFSQGLPFYRKP